MSTWTAASGSSSSSPMRRRTASEHVAERHGRLCVTPTCGAPVCVAPAPSSKIAPVGGTPKAAMPASILRSNYGRERAQTVATARLNCGYVGTTLVRVMKAEEVGKGTGESEKEGYASMRQSPLREAEVGKGMRENNQEGGALMSTDMVGAKELGRGEEVGNAVNGNVEMRENDEKKGEEEEKEKVAEGQVVGVVERLTEENGDDAEKDEITEEKGEGKENKLKRVQDIIETLEFIDDFDKKPTDVD